MTIGEWVSLISGVAVIIFGSGGVISYFSFLNERRKWQEEMALKWAEFNSGKPETESRALEGAANAVKISADALEKRFGELETKIREQEKHLEFADQTIAELKEKLQEMETEQKRYHAFVKSLATELLAELNRNGSVDLKILKHIVSKLLDGKDNDNDNQ